jgi:hypothetical protein
MRAREWLLPRASRLLCGFGVKARRSQFSRKRKKPNCLITLGRLQRRQNASTRGTLHLDLHPAL